MAVSQEFVEKSIAHQLGVQSDGVFSGDSTARQLAEQVSSGMAVSWDHAAQAPKRYNRWTASTDLASPWQLEHPKHTNALKSTHALRDILEAGADYDFMIDMQDHRVRNIVTENGQMMPMFCFNRLIGRGHGRILWPLPGYHDIDSPDFLGDLDPARIAWVNKSDRVVWRGGAGNRGRKGKNGRGNMVRMHALLRKYKNGEFDRDQTLTVLKTMQRFGFLHRYINDPRFDLGYTNSDGFILENEPFLAEYERPRIEREDFQTYKYIVVLPGNDVGSSLFWSLNSGSVALVVDCNFETFATHHFKPWEHFVPIRKGHGDVKKQLKWCDDHQDECQAMTVRAAETCKLLADPDLRKTILSGVVDGLRQRLDRTVVKPAKAVKAPASAGQPKSDTTKRTPTVSVAKVTNARETSNG